MRIKVVIDTTIQLFLTKPEKYDFFRLIYTNKKYEKICRIKN